MSERLDDDYEDDDDYDDRPRRLEPHRGGLILTLGILGLLVCGPLGIAAWIMGNNDLAAMKAGRMDRSGEGQTRAGQICGIIASVAIIFGLCALGVLMLAGVAQKN